MAANPDKNHDLSIKNKKLATENQNLRILLKDFGGQLAELGMDWKEQAAMKRRTLLNRAEFLLTQYNEHGLPTTVVLDDTFKTWLTIKPLEEDKSMDNIVDLQALANKNRKALDTTPPGDKPDWLTALAVGTIFYCVNSGKPYVERYEVIDKTDKVILLLNNLNDEVYVPVFPKVFCQYYDFVEVLIKKD